MPDDLSVAAAAAPYVAPAAKSEAAPATVDTSSTDPAPFPLPVNHLDAALGIEVMQFVNQAGGVTQSFPNQRQLDAYREAGPAEQPHISTV